MKFIGIDLAWTYKNETGYCVLSETGELIECIAEVFSDEAIVEKILSYSNEIVWIAIDAPLIVLNEEGSRRAEPLAMKDRIHGQCLRFFNANRKFLEKTYGGIRGERILALLQSQMSTLSIGGQPMLKENFIIETFPTGICLGLFPELYPLKYKLKAKIPFEKNKEDMIILLRQVAPSFDKSIPRLEAMNKKTYKVFEDKIDAFLCAYGLYQVYMEKATVRVYGEPNEGAIVLPVRK